VFLELKTSRALGCNNSRLLTESTNGTQKNLERDEWNDPPNADFRLALEE
jgi:hypothetical protein